MSLAAFLLIGHQYYAAMSAPEGPQARFVSSSGGQVDRQPQGTPGFLDSVRIAWAGLTGTDSKSSNTLGALQTRTRVAQISEQERVMREIDFWTDFTAKMGISGP